MRFSVVQEGGNATGSVTATDGPRGLRIRLRSRCRFFADALFFSTASIVVSSAPLHATYSFRRAAMYADVRRLQLPLRRLLLGVRGERVVGGDDLAL